MLRLSHNQFKKYLKSWKIDYNKINVIFDKKEKVFLLFDRITHEVNYELPWEAYVRASRHIPYPLSRTLQIISIRKS